MITFDRNQWSRSTGLGDHLPPESVITFDRNTHPASSSTDEGLDVTTCYAQPHHHIDGVLDIWGGLLSTCTRDEENAETKRGSDFDQAHPNPPKVALFLSNRAACICLSMAAHRASRAAGAFKGGRGLRTGSGLKLGENGS
jgi:hypothetical protein